MEERIHLFSTEAAFNAVYNGPSYEEPWVSLIEANGRINFNRVVGPEPQPTIDVVDFGLSSGTLWAKYNLGATDQSGYGDYFQWADIYPTSAASWDNYRYGLSGSTKYNTNDNLTLLDGYDDAAFVTLGEGWHIPTNAQIDELLANTNSAVTTDNGVTGIKLTSKTDSSKSIFFPFGGQCLENGPENFSGFGVWSENLDETFTPILHGSSLAGNNAGFGIQRVSFDRCYGINVRPVSGGTFTPDSTRITQRYGGVSKILNNKTDHYFITYDYSNTAFVELGLIQERIDYTTGKIAYYTQKVNGSMKIREDVHVTPNVGEWYMFLNYNNNVSGFTPYKLIPESTGSTTTGNTTLEYIVFKGGFNPSTSAYSSTQTLYGLTKKIVNGTVTEEYPGIITNGHMYKSLNELKADSSTYTSVYNESFKIQNKDTYWRNPSMPDPWEEHAYVDMGLPSGNLWATMNVGSTAVTDPGTYFSWGELSGKSDYSFSTYKWHTGTTGVTKYNTTDGKLVLDDEDDVAIQRWGNGWRMPTSAETYELFTATTSSITTYQGVDVIKLTSRQNGNVLYIPISGIMDGTSLAYLGSGVIMSKTMAGAVSENQTVNTYGQPYVLGYIYINSSYQWQGADFAAGGRLGGNSVRPVHPPIN